MRWLVSILLLWSALGAPHELRLAGEPGGPHAIAEISAPQHGESERRAPNEEPSPDELGPVPYAALPAVTAAGAVHCGGVDRPDSFVDRVPVPPPMA
jgi:hypothetical protein